LADAHLQDQLVTTRSPRLAVSTSFIGTRQRIHFSAARGGVRVRRSWPSSAARTRWCAAFQVSRHRSHDGGREMSTATAVAAPERLTPAARRSILGGVITLFLDSYDIYLPALVLPAALGYFEPANMSDP